MTSSFRRHPPLRSAWSWCPSILIRIPHLNKMYHHPIHVVDNINPCNSVSASFIIPCILSSHCLLLFICHYYNASKAQSLPRVRRCWLRTFSPVYIDYFCLYCILSGLPAGRIISLIGVGFVVLFAHILPILKPLSSCPFLCKPSFSLRIVPSPFLVPHAVGSTVYILSIVCPFPLYLIPSL